MTLTVVEATVAATAPAVIAVFRLAQLEEGDGGGGDGGGGCVGGRLPRRTSEGAGGGVSAAAGQAFRCSCELKHSVACGRRSMPTGIPDQSTGLHKRGGSKEKGQRMIAVVEVNKHVPS